jgi:hypothetical protein
VELETLEGDVACRQESAISVALEAGLDDWLQIRKAFLLGMSPFEDVLKKIRTGAGEVFRNDLADVKGHPVLVTNVFGALARDQGNFVVAVLLVNRIGGFVEGFADWHASLLNTLGLVMYGQRQASV